MNEPQISLTGNVAFDPVVRYTPNGVAVVDLRVGSTGRMKSGEEWKDRETLWFDVSCWKQLAENVGSSIKKGDGVTVSGRLTQRTWTREDGTKSVNLEIDATAVGVDLARCPARVQRPVRPGGSADAFPERWADRTTGEIVPTPETDFGPLVPFTDAGFDEDEHAA